MLNICKIYSNTTSPSHYCVQSDIEVMNLCNLQLHSSSYYYEKSKYNHFKFIHNKNFIKSSCITNTIMLSQCTLIRWDNKRNAKNQALTLMIKNGISNSNDHFYAKQVEIITKLTNRFIPRNTVEHYLLQNIKPNKTLLVKKLRSTL